MEFAHLWHCLPNWPLSCQVPLIQFQFQFSRSPELPPLLFVCVCVLTTSSWWLPDWLTDWPPWLARSWLALTLRRCRESHSLRVESRESECQTQPVSAVWFWSLKLCELLLLSAPALRKPLHAYITSARYDNNSHSHSYRICIRFRIRILAAVMNCNHFCWPSWLSISVPFCCACCQLSLRFVLFPLACFICFVFCCVAHTIYYNKFKCFALCSAFLWRLSMSFEMQMRRQLRSCEVKQMYGKDGSKKKS